MDKPCNVCGDIGVEAAIVTCSLCETAREHLYCMKVCQVKFPDDWHCDECKLNNSTSRFEYCVKEDLTKVLMFNYCGRENHVDKPCGSPNKLSNGIKRGGVHWERNVKTGKVKYLSALEAIKLSSGNNKIESSSKINLHADTGSSKRPANMFMRTLAKPNVHIAKPNTAFRYQGDSYHHRPANVLNNLMIQQEAMQLQKQLSGKVDILPPAMNHFFRGKPTYGLSLTPESASTSSKAETATIKASDLRKSNARKLNLSKSLPCDPALDASWMGSFKILYTSKEKELNDGIQAHPPARVRRRVYEFSKRMPQVIHFEFIPRCNRWMSLFQDVCPNLNDIGLYFFSGDIKRSEAYINLLEFMAMQDLVLRSHVNGVELLVFTSKLLDVDSQRWNDEYFLWGLFHSVDEGMASQQDDRDQVPPLRHSSDVCDNIFERGEEDRQVVNMEIDMMGGQSVGRNVVIGRRSSGGCQRKESTSRFTKHGSNSETPIFSKSPSSNYKKMLSGDDIPPGFEETFRLRLKESKYGIGTSSQTKEKSPHRVRFSGLTSPNLEKSPGSSRHQVKRGALKPKSCSQYMILDRT